MGTKIILETDQQVSLTKGQDLELNIDGQRVVYKIVDIVEQKPTQAKKVKLHEVVKGRIDIERTKPMTRDEIYDR